MQTDNGGTEKGAESSTPDRGIAVSHVWQELETELDSAIARKDTEISQSPPKKDESYGLISPAQVVEEHRGGVSPDCIEEAISNFYRSRTGFSLSEINEALRPDRRKNAYVSGVSISDRLLFPQNPSNQILYCPNGIPAKIKGVIIYNAADLRKKLGRED